MAAADTAKLVAQLSLDDKNFQRGITSANKGVGNLEKSMSNIGRRSAAGLSTAAGNLAKLGTIGAVGAIGLLAKSVSQASDLNEQLSKVKTVFGEAGASVVAFSKTTASALGVSQTEALEAAGNFGNMFKTVGLADKQSAEFSQTLVTLAADMASFNNEDPNEMLDKLRSGLSGEAEPLRRFGVLLSEASVSAEAYATGIAKTGEKLTEAQKVQARYSLILKQTKVQQGDFARTSGGLANQIRILKASFADTGATIGTALLPKITELAVKLNKAIKDNQPAIIAFANKLPGAFDKIASFAERIPWDAIGSGLEKAAFFADKLFDAFLALPPEVQGTLIALAGLNKLSGGAITGIVSELGKGLIKGVLGINAGVVHIKAGVVNGVGGTPAGGPAGGLAGKLAPAAAAVSGVVILGVTQTAAADLTTAIAGKAAGQIATSTGSGSPVNITGPLDRLLRALNGDFRSGAEVAANTDKMVGKMDTLGIIANKTDGLLDRQRDQNAKTAQLLDAVHNSQSQAIAIGAKNQAAAFATRDAVNNKVGPLAAVMSGVKTAVDATKLAAAHAGQQTAAAIRDKDLSVANYNSVTVNNRVSVQETIKTQTTFKQFNKFIS